ncbi:MAG: carboxymuconolactone decarboxylase [Saprospiraceae bacterium]
MPHIPLDESLPGMRSLLAYHPAIAPVLTGLMQVMMRTKEGLHPGERELIAAYISRLNQCYSCENIHSAVTCHLFDLNELELNTIKKDFNAAAISPRLKALLAIVKKTQQGGNYVTSREIENAKSAGCTDLEIHDSILIAALFSMFNRYIDGLDLKSNDTPESLNERGQHIANKGYSHDA